MGDSAGQAPNRQEWPVAARTADEGHAANPLDPPLVVLAGAIAASGVLASSEPTRPGVIRITNRELAREIVDLAHRATAGDQLVVSQLLFNRRITSGHSVTRRCCARTLGAGASRRRSRSCTMTFFCPEGEAGRRGAVHNLVLFTLPVVGGTGIYDNVGGTLTATFLARSRSVSSCSFG